MKKFFSPFDMQWLQWLGRWIEWWSLKSKLAFILYQCRCRKHIASNSQAWLLFTWRIYDCYEIHVQINKTTLILYPFHFLSRLYVNGAFFLRSLQWPDYPLEMWKSFEFGENTNWKRTIIHKIFCIHFIKYMNVLKAYKHRVDWRFQIEFEK